MIRPCRQSDLDEVYGIINDAAEAYRGIIPADRWKEPYMSREYLQHEIDDGVLFWGYEEKAGLIGVMGIQVVQDVTLIRHAYVRTVASRQRHRREAVVGAEAEDPGAHAGGHVEGRRLGNTVLRKTRVSARDGAAEGTAAPEVLEDPRTAGGNVGCAGGSDVV